MIGLIACCKTKLDRPAPVRELYTSPLFKLSLAYAEAHCSAVYVASAQHDLLELDRVLAPYNRTMASLTPMQRKLFGAAVARGLVDRHGSSFDLLVLAGDAYERPIVSAFVRTGARVRVVGPLAGMQIGERLSFLSRAAQAAATKPAARPVSNLSNGGGS